MGSILTEHQNSFDFGGSFSTIVVKEGGSEMMHIDWRNSTTSLTFITLVNGRSVYFCIPLQLGQFLIVVPRLLSHFVAHITDKAGHQLKL